MPTHPLPLVSVAIPLFQSRRFLDCIIRNIEAIDYPNLEVIISDRHCLDDTIELLAERFAADRRIRCIKGADRLNWVEHYDLLLRIASGRYFLWMPHDDDYPPDYISQLVSCLESRPDVVLAYGRLEVIWLYDRPRTWTISSELPVVPGEPWSLRVALRLFLFWNLWITFRGVFRRDVVMQSKLFVRPTYDGHIADTSWLFALALKGRFYFVPSCYCEKRFYATSTSAQWKPRRSRHAVSGCIVLCSYIKDFAPNRREACYGIAVIVRWTLLQIMSLSARNWRFLPQPLRSSLRKLLERILPLRL